MRQACGSAEMELHDALLLPSIKTSSLRAQQPTRAAASGSGSQLVPHAPVERGETTPTLYSVVRFPAALDRTPEN